MHIYNKQQKYKNRAINQFKTKLKTNVYRLPQKTKYRYVSFERCI